MMWPLQLLEGVTPSDIVFLKGDPGYCMAKGLERVEVGTSGEVSAGSPRGDDGGRLRGQQLGDRKWG